MGRPWTKVDFKVKQIKAGNATSIQSFLRTNYSLSPPTPIPARLFTADSTYQFLVTLCNFLYVCSSGSHLLSVVSSDAALPTVTILGSSNQVITRSQQLTLICKAFVESCSGSVSYSNLAFDWTVSEMAAGNARNKTSFRSR